MKTAIGIGAMAIGYMLIYAAVKYGPEGAFVRNPWRVWTPESESYNPASDSDAIPPATTNLTGAGGKTVGGGGDGGGGGGGGGW